MCSGLLFTWSVALLHPPTANRAVWVRLFLLLLPIGALIVSVFRTVIGITTFGTFGPALLRRIADISA